MKRTLTAAATLLAGSAGAVGFAGTAAAAETPELPAELPVDNNLAQTVYHAAATLHSAKTVVGDVVPATQQVAGRAAEQPVQDVQDLAGGALAGPAGDVAQGVTGGPVGDVVENSPVGQVTGGVTGRSASPVDALPVDNLPTSELPVGGDVLGSVTGRATSPVEALPVDNLPVGDVVTQVTGSLPVGG